MRRSLGQIWGWQFPVRRRVHRYDLSTVLHQLADAVQARLKTTLIYCVAHLPCNVMLAVWRMGTMGGEN